jgi:hypothetical protein
MRADSTVAGEADRPGASDDGILAAIVFAIVSILLIATLPLALDPWERYRALRVLALLFGGLVALVGLSTVLSGVWP